MIGMKLRWLILEVLLLGGFLYFGSNVALIFAIVMILIPLCSIPLNLYICKRIELTVTTQQNLKKGELGNFVLTFVNKTIFPILYLHGKTCIKNQLNGEEHILKIRTWLPAKKEQKVILQAGSAYCGRLKISVEKIYVCDCFGLFGIRCKKDASGYMTVQPDTYEPAVTLTLN